MAQISQAIKADLSGYVPVTQYNQPAVSPTNEMQPGYNTMIRCPLPPIFEAQPDSLRQFYVNGKVPQTRLLSALTNGISSGGGTGGNAIISTVVEGPVVPITPTSTAQNTSITTTVLGPNQKFVGTLTAVSRSFQLLNVASTVAARIVIYGTGLAQMNDLYRNVDQPPPAGSAQGIITDVVLDTAPYTWNFQNRVGANGEVPQNPEAFMTIENISAAAVPITVTLQFVSLEA